MDDQIECPNCAQHYPGTAVKCPRCKTPNPANPEAVYEENEELKKRLQQVESELRGAQEPPFSSPSATYKKEEHAEKSTNYPPGGGYVGSRDDYPAPRQKSQATKAIAASIFAVAGIVAFLVIAGVGPFSDILNREPNLPDADSQDGVVDVETDDETPKEIPEVDVIEEPAKEQIIDLLETQVTFLGSDIKSFTIKIPDENVGFLKGSIIPEANTAVDVIWSYNRQQVAYTIFGASTDQIEDHNREVNLPVNGGDAISLTIKTSDSQPRQNFSQDVSIHLYVSYIPR